MFPASNCVSIVRLSGIVRQSIHSSWRRKMTFKIAFLYTHARTLCVHSQWKPGNNPKRLFGIWHKIHYIWITFGDNETQNHHVLSMVYPQIGLDIAVTSKTGNSAKHLQKTAPVQAGIPMKPLEATSFFPEQCHRGGEGKGTGTYQILHIVHKNIHVSFVAAKIIMQQNATNHKCCLSIQNKKKEHQNIYRIWKLLRF